MTAVTRFRRVVVGVSAETGAGVFAAAADVAHWLSADLSGLFIEDESLLGFADLPFAAEIAIAGAARPLRRADVERAFRAASAAARRRLEAAARAARISATFASERGAVAAIVAKAAGPGDILMFVEPGRAIERACAITSGLLAAAFGSAGSILYVPESALGWRGGVAAYVDGAADATVLAVAARIAAARQAPMAVIAAGGEEAWRPVLDRVLAELGREAPPVEVRPPAGDGLAAALAASPDLDDKLIVLARTPATVASPAALRALAQRRRAPVLVIEPDGPGG